ncbi:MAG: magnesium transporter CorA family protein [Candidatus Daviesbacteria bacterium]|nr:magnesium transporter CorA family protein [Candidatus Daviesbacteria bacterium]
MNVRSVRHNDLTLVEIHDLKELEIKELEKNYQVSQIHIDDYIQGQQVPKIEVSKNYTLIVLDFPYLDTSSEEEGENLGRSEVGVRETIKKVITTPVTFPKLFFTQAEKKRIKTGHVNFFVGSDFLIVLHSIRTPQIDEIYEQCHRTLRHREEMMSSGPSYLLYRIVDVLIDSTFNIMSAITTMIDEIDINLLKEHPPVSIVEDIASTRRNIVFFKSMIEPALNIFSELSEGEQIQMGTTNGVYWKSLLGHLQKIRYRLQGSYELIEGISRSHESLLTVRTNEIVKVLTMFTAVLLPLTLLASAYGMNIVGLPHAEDPNILTKLSLIMGATAGMMILLFRFRKWI